MPRKLGSGSVKKWAQARSRREAKARERKREGVKQPPLSHDQMALYLTAVERYMGLSPFPLGHNRVALHSIMTEWHPTWLPPSGPG